MSAMLTNYLKIAFRNLLKHKVFSLINILGLAVGLAASIIIGLFVHLELSYDKFHTHKERVYRVVLLSDDFTGGGIAKVWNAMGPAIAEDVPDVEAVVRFHFLGATTMKVGDKLFSENNGYYADEAFSLLFDFQWVEGDPTGALASPGGVVLTSETAKRYFGERPALDQLVELQDGRTLKVTGVIKGLPQNTHLNFSFLVSMASYPTDEINSWSRNNAYTYLLLKETALAAGVPQKILPLVLNHRDADRQEYEALTEQEKKAIQPYQLQRLDKIYLESHLFREMARTGDTQQVTIGIVLAVLILVVASINFMNLSTARSSLRAKEVGIRKASGALRGQLVAQFLTESLLMSLVATFISIGLVEWALPQASFWLQKDLTINYLTMLPVLLVLAVFVGLLAGLYPSVFLASFKPNEVLKGKKTFSSKNGLRKSLIVFQFFLSICLIIGSVTIYRQVNYMQTKELGFDKEAIVVMQSNSKKLIESHKQLLDGFKSLPGVEAACFTGNLPGGGDWGIPVLAEGFTQETMPQGRVLCVDTHFVSTFGLEIVSGRNFSPDIQSDTEGAYIINEEAARQLGWDEPVGKQMGMPAIERPMGRVIGVVKDFHFRSMREKIQPIVFFMQPAWSNIFSVKLKKGSPQATLAGIEKVWEGFDPLAPFEPVFYDEQIDDLYRGEMRLQWLVRWFTGLGIFIASMGLFGLASLTATTRTKEFGIRKVLGAGGRQIVFLLSSEFLKLILLAFVLSIPVAWYLLEFWLAGFVYRVEISVVTFLLTLLGVAALAFGTVAYHAIRSASANPVKSLRYE